jgi:ATPase subunit of ABC transporter with duplicated ATPase domains
MDEPGNDLDTDMLAVMEDLLDTWPGTLIVVSHDRYLLERVTDQQFALIGGKVRHLPGGVQDYLDMTEAIKNGKDPFADEKAGAGKGKKGGSAGTAGSTTEGTAGNSASGSATAETASSAPSTPKLSGKAFHEASKRVSAIERKLAKLEDQKADLEQQMAAHDPSDYEGLGKLNDQLQAVADESEELELEWMELSEQLE